MPQGARLLILPGFSLVLLVMVLCRKSYFTASISSAASFAALFSFAAYFAALISSAASLFSLRCIYFSLVAIPPLI